ncbi:hypothetical protein HDF16_004278 [Granulicella aggregans]|uniref:Uncharacterized protein n=1 Tax=Granulicella aggregans TaxID=474949 RepID=A0A7W8E5D4_9BACT|nr:hypothetical protein [Granulicella aggregans]MBB5059552.1 hypothetical protein [Granulicella aggregans]
MTHEFLLNLHRSPGFVQPRTVRVAERGLTARMLYGTSKEVPILAAAEAVLNNFQIARTRHPK